MFLLMIPAVLNVTPDFVDIAHFKLIVLFKIAQISNIIRLQEKGLLLLVVHYITQHHVCTVCKHGPGPTHIRIIEMYQHILKDLL